MPPKLAILPPSDAYNYPSINLEASKLVAQTEFFMAQGVGYELGAKAVPLTVDEFTIRHIDCSGFVRLIIFHAVLAFCFEVLEIPDGSFNQHDWANKIGLKVSSYSAGLRLDNIVRIAFLSPADGGGVGHVVLIYNGWTMESHGSHGPDRRKWNASIYPFMAKMSVYVLAVPAS